MCVFFRLGFSDPSWQQSSPDDTDDLSSLSYNKRNILKWEKDEPAGEFSTISPVLYCNVNHPELKVNYPGKIDCLFTVIYGTPILSKKV